MIPTLQALSDGGTRHLRELEPLVAEAVGLTAEQKAEPLPSGNKLRYRDRIGWCVSRLTNVGALHRPQRGHYQITAAGRELLTRFPKGVTGRELEVLGADAGSMIRTYTPTVPRRKTPETIVDREASALTPTEQVQNGIARIHEEVAAELLERLRAREPAFFEQVVVDLLLSMGYGGTTGAGTVTQRSNDGGIDGVIDQDVLGINRVYVQAKRYAEENPVGRPELQAFVGALAGKADSGVFITTSTFAKPARDYVNTVPTRIILIDGSRLTQLMIRYAVGVQVKDTYKIVEVDKDFFE